MGERYDVTIALTTRNRARLLARTLDHLRRLRIPEGLVWEIVIVNRNSTDDTTQVLADATDLPVRTYFEAREGRSHAANTATERARGELILWTNDDVRPDPEWVQAYVNAAAWYPDSAYFGGPVRPWFETPPPRWFEKGIRAIGSHYGLFDVGPEARPFTSREMPSGPNMAIRRGPAKRHPWDPARRPEEDGTGEAYVFEGMRKDGLPGHWIPQAVVEHFVPAPHMSLDFLRYRYRAQGGEMMQNRGGAVAACLSLLLVTLLLYPVYLLLRALRASPALWLRPFCRAQVHLGKIKEFERRRSARGP